jgi:hypothetical protein
MISAHTYRLGTLSSRVACRRLLSDGGNPLRRKKTAPSPSAIRASPSTPATNIPLSKPLTGVAAAKTQGAGTGKMGPGFYIKDRGPVSWASLFLVGVAAASIVAYYNIERERRLETAMGRVVSSESGGWTPNPDTMAPRKFKLTPWGWFPEDDGFGACKLGRQSSHVLQEQLRTSYMHTIPLSNS